MLIKQNGSFKKVNTERFGKTYAINLGAKLVDNSPSTEFKIRKAKGKATKFNEFLSENVAKFEKKGSTFSELKAFRFDSVAEKRSKARKGGIFDVSF